MSKTLSIILLLCFFNTFSQSTSFGDVIKGDVKKYKEVWYKAKKDKNGYTKLDKLHYDTYVKNDNNEFIKETLFPPEKHEIPQNIYDENKLKIKTINYYKDGKVLNRRDYIYKDGKLTEEFFYYSSDTIISNKKYFYKNKLKVKEIKINHLYGMFKTTDTTKTTFEYDSRSNLIKSSFYSAHNTNIDKYSYNNKNYLTSIHYSHNNIDFKLSHLIKYVKYDNHNWTSLFFESEFKSGKSNKCYYIEREIYYE